MQSKRSSVFRAAFLGTVLTGVTSGIVVVGLASATQAFADQASASFVVPKAKCGPILCRRYKRSQAAQAHRGVASARYRCQFTRIVDQ